MAGSDSLEYYKLKEDLGRFLKDEISRAVQNERDLQQKYIGIGLKVAAVGIATAVIVVGLFGIKSIYDVRSTIDTIPDTINTKVNEEIVKRFDKNNPVAKFEMILLGSAARSIATSITMQAENSHPVAIEDTIADIITRALVDKNIDRETKLSLISAMNSATLSNISPSIGQSVVALVQQSLAENQPDEELLRRCLKFFASRNAERYTAIAEKIFEARASSPAIMLAVGRYAGALEKNNGEDLIKKLEKSEDSNLKYLIHVRNLRVGKVKQVDIAIFSDAIQRSFNADPDDDLGLSDVIEGIGSINDGFEPRTEVILQLVEALREYASSKSLVLAVEDNSPDSMSFRFYNAAARPSSASIDQKHFQTLIEVIGGCVRDSLRQSKGEFTDSTRQMIEFWLPRIDRGTEQRRAGALSYKDLKKVRFIAADGPDTPVNTGAAKATIAIDGSGPNAKLVIKWSDDTGEAKSARLKTIVDFNARFLTDYGIWSRTTQDF